MAPMVPFLAGLAVLLAAPAVYAAEAPSAVSGSSSFVLTTESAWTRSQGDVEALRKLVDAQARLLREAEEADLVVAADAIAKDLRAIRELLVFAEERLASLKIDLAPDPENPRPMPDPLVLPQVRELKLLRDQGERIYLSGKRFLEQMRRPTGTRVEAAPKG